MIPVLLMLAELALAPGDPKPVSTTIAAIRANTKKFDGQVVRLTGYVNHCQPLSCSIDEQQGTERGAHLSIGANSKFDQTVKTLLPTYIEFDARFDAACLTTAICDDRSPELTIVSLRSVVSPEPPEIEN